MNKQTLEKIKELCPNHKFAIVKIIKDEEQEIINQFKKHNGLIEDMDDVYEFLDRLSKCRRCNKVFWDKLCLDCVMEVRLK